MEQGAGKGHLARQGEVGQLHKGLGLTGLDGDLRGRPRPFTRSVATAFDRWSGTCLDPLAGPGSYCWNER